MTISGTFVPIDLWTTKAGLVYTDKKLAEFKAHKDGDSDPYSGGYPVGPSTVVQGYRRESDGKIFIIREVTCADDMAASALVKERERLSYFAGDRQD